MSWKNVVGHEPVIRLLKGQLLKERLAHTTLFVGLEGIGKRTLALEFAKALECERGTGEPCGECDSCRKIAQGSFPDVMTVAPESGTAQWLRLKEAAPRPSGQIGIDQVRGLENWMMLTPHSGRWKVGLIDGADSLTEQAAHACLKFLEEPPERSILILITAALHRLPATLVSRCHLVRCAPQGIPRVARFLMEQEHLDPALSGMLAAAAGGRLGLALRFHRQERLSAKNAAVDQLLAACRQGVLEIPLGNSPRPEVEEALDWLAAWWRDLLVLSVGGDPAWVIHQDRMRELQRARNDRVEELLKRVERTYRVQEALQRNASPRIGLGALLSQ